MTKNNFVTEKIPLVMIYKQNNNLYVEELEEILNGFELFGFLKIYIKFLEDQLYNDLEVS